VRFDLHNRRTLNEIPSVKNVSSFFSSMSFTLRSLTLLMVTFHAIGSAKSFENVEYSRPDGQSLRFDAEVPDGTGPFPAAIIVHGGAWVTGDRKASVRPLFAPLAQGGLAWFSISYRLADVMDARTLQSAIASAATVSKAEDDVRQAVAYVRKNASQYNIDPNRIALIGESAGAQLASMAALKPEVDAPVQAVVAFYSPSDLSDIVKNSTRIPDSLRRQVQGTAFEGLLMNVLKQLSPITWVTKSPPPFFMIHGTGDTLVPYQQSIDMCSALRSAGGECQLYPVTGGGHGIRWWE